MTKILLFDSNVIGHHSGYVHHLIDYLSKHQDKKQYFFLLHPDFADKFPLIIEDAAQCVNVTMLYITHQELANIQGKGLISDSIAAYRLVNKYAKKLLVNHVILLWFNTFQFALGLFKPCCTMSGILFGQFERMELTNRKDKLRYWRKYFQTWFFARNKQLTNIFILNDNQSVEKLNRKFKTNIFKMLPDPVPNIQPLSDFDIYQHYAIEQDRTIFLQTGAMDERKGTFDILNAVKLIPTNIQKKVCLLFVGKSKNTSFEEKFIELSNYFQFNNQMQIIRDNQFIENSMMKSLFDQCDCVLMPYKNPEASSGILGLAAKSGKPVIGTKSGLIGEIIEKYSLGKTISNIRELADAIQFYTKNNLVNNDTSSTYLLNRTVDNFSRKVLAYTK
jgi:glycosyltransferase involved in cell wall biosynthesis